MTVLSNNTAEVARHKTAIGRATLSRPIKLACMDGILSEGTRLFDYGCGRGDDLRILETMGIEGVGWDPVHRSKASIEPAPVVNLGYVVNVIEDPNERQETVRRAWSLAEQVLIVGARLSAEAETIRDPEIFGDGYLTSRGTFQKFFEQQELKTWIDQCLNAAALPAGPGVFYVFRDDEARATFQASRFKRRISIPCLARPVALYEQYQELLRPLMDFMAAHGRLPADDELPNTLALHETFGSTKRAFRIIERSTKTHEWEAIGKERAQDLLIYLALARFDGRPPYSRLPLGLQRDIKSFFNNYKKACAVADELLFSVGKIERVSEACTASPIGKLTPEALYIHESALDQLPPVLRIFEGCARGYIGRVEDANIIKLNRRASKISYLSYPEFEADPHPALATSLSVDLQSFRVKNRDYRGYRNPPILHRKETFLERGHPLYAKFARLTRNEESKGLYEEAARIGTRDGWNLALSQKGWKLQGHRLLRDA